MSQEIEHTHRPIIGITMGDINGVGPEIILKTLSEARILKICIPVVYGSSKVLNKYKKNNQGEEVHFHFIKSIDQLNNKKLNLVNVWEEDINVEPGQVTQEAGNAALMSLEAATNDLKAKKIDAIVTAPINKKNIQSETFKFPGHTEYFEHHFGNENQKSLMFLITEGLKVAVVTGHVAVSDLKNKLTENLISEKIKAILASLKKDFGIEKPKLAVLGLNPHASDNGLIGNEEETFIIPAIEKFRSQGNLVFGPFSADGFFGAKLFTKYDAVLAMYHDQGLIPFKTLAMETGVNFTAGLPIIRTSPDHGTAYDIAGKNKADETSMREAIYAAIDIWKVRELGQFTFASK